MALTMLRSAAQTLFKSSMTSGKAGVTRVTVNYFSSDSNPKHGISKSVFISQSNDIFTNLALEDWLYRNFDFTNHHVMMLWRNDPCVVVGRHQNPWQEADVESLTARGFDIARRNSGGGTVYHDKGNLNITFFTPKERYNRMTNLMLIEKTLKREWNLNIEINEREDLIMDSVYKVSGTASRLGRPNAYHHCTLMVDVNKDNLKMALQKSATDKFKTTALQSVSAPVSNLSDAHGEVQMERLMERLGWEFMRTTALQQADAGWNHVSKQNGFQMINPTEEWFPGLDEIKEGFSSWQWKFGKTPDFSVERFVSTSEGRGFYLKMSIAKGFVTGDVSMVLPSGMAWGSLTGNVPLQTTIVGQKYSPNLFNILEEAVRNQSIPFHEVSREAAASS